VNNGTVARAVSEKLSISRYIADMLPADKADVVKDLQSRGHVVAMVGDGMK